MTPELYGYDFRSQPYPFTPNGTINIRNDYLANASGWTAPEIRTICIVFTGTVIGVHLTQGALGRDFPKLFTQVRFRHDGQDQIFASGETLRNIEIIDYGGVQHDPGDVAADATNATYVGILRLPFACPRNERDRDTSIALSDFLANGELTVTCAPTVPTGWTAPNADWNITVFADVQEGREKETKSVRRIKEVSIGKREDMYDIGGSARIIAVSSVLATTGATSLAAVTAVNSVTMKWPAQYQTFMLQDRYRREQMVPAANDPALAATPTLIPLIFPRRSQKTGRLPDVVSFHLDLLTAPPTASVLITDTIVNRNPISAANILGFKGDAIQAAAAINTNGIVVGKSGNHHYKDFSQTLAKRLPNRHRPGGTKVAGMTTPK